MKKIYTFSIVAIAFMFAQSANAQSSASAEEKAKAQTAPNNAPAATVVLPSSTQAKSAQAAPVAARPENSKMQAAKQEIAELENKINVNRNTAGFDLKTAEARLRQLKESYGIK